MIDWLHEVGSLLPSTGSDFDHFSGPIEFAIFTFFRRNFTATYEILDLEFGIRETFVDLPLHHHLYQDNRDLLSSHLKKTKSETNMIVSEAAKLNNTAMAHAD